MEKTILQENIDKATRLLMLRTDSDIEKDKIIRSLNPDLDGEETVELLYKKASYVQSIFNLDMSDDIIVMPPNATDVDTAATVYYSLLGLLTSPFGQEIISAKQKNLELHVPRETL